MEGHGQAERDIAGAIGGDRDALRRVWQEHRRWVATILLAHKPRSSDLEDLLQAVAVQVVRKIGEIRDAGAFKPWLRTVAINAARAEGRKQTRRGPQLRLVGDVEGGETLRGLEGREEASRLMEIARELPEGYREPLLMRCVQGMSYRQIGAVLELPETTIETRIARARRMLREMASDQSPNSTGQKPGRQAGRGSVVV